MTTSQPVITSRQSVLPSTSGKKIQHGRPNKLFFGTFTQIEEGAWVDSILDELHADETVFRTMLHDIYQNGQVLQRKKYKYLALAYRVFIAALCLTMITFVIEHVRFWMG